MWRQHLVTGRSNNVDEVVNEVGGSWSNEEEENEIFNDGGGAGAVHNEVGIEDLNIVTVDSGMVELVLDVPDLSDNEDEETIEARIILRNFIASQGKPRTENEQSESIVEVGSSSIAIGAGHIDAVAEIDDGAIQSDDDVSYITTSDEDDSEVEHGRKRKAIHPVCKEHEDWLMIGLGMIFISKEQFKKAVDELSFKEGRQIKWVKNDKVRLRAICKEAKKKGCRWKTLLAKDSPLDSWMVKTFQQEHTCNWGVVNKRYTSRHAAKHLVNSRGATCLYMNYDSIFQAIWNEKNIELTSVQCKKTKQQLKRTFEGASKAEYGMLFDYANELRSKDPEANIVLHAHRPIADVNPTFMRMYVCFSALKKVFLVGCKRIIGDDGAFLKGAHKGELLTAIGRDANNQMFPIAWAVVEVEKTETWERAVQREGSSERVGIGYQFITARQLQAQARQMQQAREMVKKNNEEASLGGSKKKKESRFTKDLGVDEEGIKGSEKKESRVVLEDLWVEEEGIKFDLQASSIAGSKLSRFLETEQLETWKAFYERRKHYSSVLRTGPDRSVEPSTGGQNGLGGHPGPFRRLDRPNPEEPFDPSNPIDPVNRPGEFFYVSIGSPLSNPVSIAFPDLIVVLHYCSGFFSFQLSITFPAILTKKKPQGSTVANRATDCFSFASLDPTADQLLLRISRSNSRSASPSHLQIGKQRAADQISLHRKTCLKPPIKLEVDKKEP
ncbi:hypothetical protein SLEP1_g48069 [Rubroshorea leprosula]|uniref:MULE transposase domain-containing protein n=1 Tax=Rubroshorea leprosula TaxID=152421 RepID=A0AAV5LVF1_9ROSI|nr:hypothetical protein SLEP1_g48069 [Rubroshorea leprosula]